LISFCASLSSLSLRSQIVKTWFRANSVKSSEKFLTSVVASNCHFVEVRIEHSTSTPQPESQSCGGNTTLSSRRGRSEPTSWNLALHFWLLYVTSRKCIWSSAKPESKICLVHTINNQTYWGIVFLRLVHRPLRADRLECFFSRLTGFSSVRLLCVRGLQRLIRPYWGIVWLWNINGTLHAQLPKLWKK
jgi:hypothetical protein